MIPNKSITLIAILLLLPVLDSLFIQGFFNLNWHSPQLMALLSDWFRVVKLAMVCSGLWLLFQAYQLSKPINRSFIKTSILVSGGIIAAVQIALLALGIFMAMLGPVNNTYHKFEVGSRTLLVHNSDPGAMGKAYHLVSVQCTRPFGFYRLHFVKRFNWLGDVDFYAQGEKLFLTADSLEQPVLITLTPQQQCESA